MSKISRRAAMGILGAPLCCSALAQQTSPTRERISLNGDSGALRIPEPWPRSTRGNTARYERSVAIPMEWTDRRITLSADCINSYAEVFVDGTKAGEMRYPCGEVDLTSSCRPGQTHAIAMQVVAMPLKAVMLSYSDSAAAKTVEGTVQRRGIVGDVYLNSMPSGPRIAGVKVETSVRRWEIAVEASLEGAENGGPYRLVARVDGKEFTGAAPRITAPWHPEKLWDIHTPQNSTTCRSRWWTRLARCSTRASRAIRLSRVLDRRPGLLPERHAHFFSSTSRSTMPRSARVGELRGREGEHAAPARLRHQLRLYAQLRLRAGHARQLR